MFKSLLSDGDESFEVTQIKTAGATHGVLFSVGGGGNPERHRPLLQSLADHGCTIIAPHFERLVGPRPAESHLLMRARRLQLALNAIANPSTTAPLPIIGVGHSIGATMLLALAGAQAWLGPGHRLAISPDQRLDRLALLAPASGFFQAPGALAAVSIPILVWAGERDVITPVNQVALLKQIPAVVDMRVSQNAGHFSFMHVPPPNTIEPLPDREAFLAQLTAAICHFTTT